MVKKTKQTKKQQQAIISLTFRNNNKEENTLLKQHDVVESTQATHQESWFSSSGYITKLLCDLGLTGSVFSFV